MDLLLSTISSSDKNLINLIPFVRDLLNKMVEELRHQFLFMDQFPPHPNDFFLKPLLSRLKFSLSAILILMPSLQKSDLQRPSHNSNICCSGLDWRGARINMLDIKLPCQNFWLFHIKKETTAGYLGTGRWGGGIGIGLNEASFHPVCEGSWVRYTVECLNV